MKVDPGKLLFFVDLTGTAVFALEGAAAGIQNNLDLFGVLVLSFVTALAGGVIRDILIGDIPPASLRHARYATVAFGAGAFAFFFHHFVQHIPPMAIVFLDAAGLGLFSVTGVEKALTHKMNPLIAVMMGTVTAVGGGTLRDLLLAQIPTVLRSDVYATAALAGGLVLILCRKLGLSEVLSAIVGGVFCFALRMVSVWQHWNLPTVNGH